MVATIYAAVGQAGASGYIAAMSLFGVAPAVMKTTALVLNLVVATIGTTFFLRAGRVSWRNVYPFAVLGFPFSVIGGAVQLPEGFYYPLVGVVLVLSGIQMTRSAFGQKALDKVPTSPPWIAALAVGAVIGFVSGTTGTGGGVFLAPVILALNWGTARQTAATTAIYNLMNSAAALLGASRQWGHLPQSLPWWILAVALGGVAGAYVGSRYLPEKWLRLILAVLLTVSGLKLLF
ncbi:sulfite exporter TauE/SafE family protein [Rhizobium sp. FKL33]|uniref:sulfite exporter TauE/SafE family protein n=1 Tax=Rhizobium sp. FKL33 TaxID=2562307 RepID=UPI001FED7EC8|nr:sulfite exporter TauE/SafE family protein [Rhizobium sp. FKL33]